MAKSKSWVIESDEEEYKIFVDMHRFTGRHKIFLNGKYQYYKPSFMEYLVGYKKWLEIPNKVVFVVVRGNKVDCAVDGYYLDSKKEFKQKLMFAKWSWIFVVACLAIPIVSIGGAIPIVIGLLGAMLAAKASVSTSNNVINFILAFAITGIAWVVFLAVLSFFTSTM